MPALLAAVEGAISYILQVLGITQLMYGLLQQFGVILSTAAQEHYRYEIQGYTLAANNQLADATFGLAAIKTELDGIGLAIIALGNPQQTAQPVTLPTVAPSGYGGLDATATGDAVWNHANYAGYAMGDTMRSLVYFFDGMNANLAWPSPSGGPFVISANVGAFNAEPWGHNPDYGLDSILVTDATVGDWLNRVRGWGETWSLDPDSLYWRTFGLGNPANNTAWYCTLSEVQFAWIKAQLAGTGVLVPPVWPGLANVTYGAPQSMDAPNGSLTGPADGYKIEIDAQPSWAGKFDFGSVQAWRNVGAIAFVDDENIPEPAQTLGLASVIYTPQRMAHSAGALYRIATGYHATATPYVINS